MSLRFDGKVVVVTGAGGGLGKAYSEFFASRGACVVVNDLGGSHTGDGKGNARAADAVVAEIVKNGGKAVANYDSVENGDKIIATAIQSFGKIDILINNAGILRDKSFSKMTDQDWDLIMSVHVKGSYKCAKAAWDYMIKQGYGRIINTASAAGIYGNFGQANYSAGLFGLSNALAREGERKNVLCNTIAPLAASRLTETIMPPEMLAALKPEFITPLVAYLCHDSCKENGALFEVGAGWVGKLRWERSKGAVFKADSTFTPASVEAKWGEITDFRDPSYPESIMDTDWVGLLEKAKELPGNPNVPPIRFDGRVVIVTGAGNGLGRAYALLFGKLGASVVVNDLGGPVNGQPAAADKVVKEILTAGGKAVANYDSVENGDKIVEQALQVFGKVDILVNNAGILRDKSFTKMTDQDWDLVQRVHLRGSYKTIKAVWPVFLKQKYGRIINTSSAVGLQGNFGQANYSSAKAALIAFSNTLALEGGRSNIVVNTIAPNAGTAMTATVMPPEMVEALKPDYVAPLVAFLAHENNKESGSIFEVGSGWIAKVRWQRSGGFGFPVNETLLPEHVASMWERITSFSDGRATYPRTTQDSFSAVQGNFENVSKKSPKTSVAGSKSKIDVEGAKQAVMKSATFEYTERDVILYALGLGAKRTDLNLVYENDEKFITLPTYGVIPAFAYQINNVSLGDYLPDFNPMMLLHGEQFLEIKKPFATSGKLISTGRIVDILDKGSGAAVTVGVTSKDASGDVVSENEFTMFIRGLGGFGGRKEGTNRGAATASNEPPSRAPDAILSEKTSEDLAAIYRLSGDYNPLHIDPNMSAMGGFTIPILHGLATFGIAGKHVLKAFCGNDPSKFKSIKVRFAKHVFPGETIETHMWKEGSKVIFQVKVVERGVIAVSNAAVELFETSSKPKDSSSSSFQAPKIFSALESAFSSLTPSAKESMIKKVNAVFSFEIKNSSGETQNWFIDMKKATVGSGIPPSSDLKVSVLDSDFLLLSSGKLNPQKAFSTGKIKVKGNVMLATKLEPILLLATGGKAKI